MHPSPLRHILALQPLLPTLLKVNDQLRSPYHNISVPDAETIAHRKLAQEIEGLMSDPAVAAVSCGDVEGMHESFIDMEDEKPAIRAGVGHQAMCKISESP